MRELLKLFVSQKKLIALLLVFSVWAQPYSYVCAADSIDAIVSSADTITAPVDVTSVTVSVGVPKIVSHPRPLGSKILVLEPLVETISIGNEEIPNVTMLGDFDITYYCCEKYEHVCGTGSGITASGRPVTAYTSVAVDTSMIPLDSRVFVDFEDGEGWHEYSADDVGALVKNKHLDIAVETHTEALSQTKLSGKVGFIPPE